MTLLYAFFEGECHGSGNLMSEHNSLMFLSLVENTEQPKPITFMVWLDERQELLPINEKFSFAPLKAKMKLDDLMALTLREMVGIIEQVDGGWFIGKAYHNTFDQQTIIPYNLPEAAPLQLFLNISMGQLVRRVDKNYKQARQLSAYDHAIEFIKGHLPCHNNHQHNRKGLVANYKIDPSVLSQVSVCIRLTILLLLKSLLISLGVVFLFKTFLNYILSVFCIIFVVPFELQTNQPVCTIFTIQLLEICKPS